MKNKGPVKEIDIKEVERLAGLGLAECHIATSLGIHRETFRRKKRQQAAFMAALKRGQAAGIATIADNLYQQSMGGNVSATIFYLKNRAGWSDNGPRDNQDQVINITVTHD